MKISSSISAAIALCLAPVLDGRTWTSADGKKIEAEFVESDGKNVTIRRSDGRKFTLAHEKLSATDREFIAAKLEEDASGKKEEKPKISGEITSPGDGSEVKRQLSVRGRTKGAPKGYVAMAFRRDPKVDYLLPNIEYSRANKTFSTTLYHGDHELGEWSVHLYVLPEDDAKSLAKWMENVVALYKAGKQDQVKPYEGKLIGNAIEVATAQYFLEAK